MCIRDRSWPARSRLSARRARARPCGLHSGTRAHAPALPLLAPQALTQLQKALAQRMSLLPEQ
eukprot:3710370-Rhodomonas_salina.1